MCSNCRYSRSSPRPIWWQSCVEDHSILLEDVFGSASAAMDIVYESPSSSSTTTTTTTPSYYQAQGYDALQAHVLAGCEDDMLAEMKEELDELKHETEFWSYILADLREDPEMTVAQVEKKMYDHPMYKPR